MDIEYGRHIAKSAPAWARLIGNRRNQARHRLQNVIVLEGQTALPLIAAEVALAHELKAHGWQIAYHYGLVDLAALHAQTAGQVDNTVHFIRTGHLPLEALQRPARWYPLHLVYFVGAFCANYDDAALRTVAAASKLAKPTGRSLRWHRLPVNSPPRQRLTLGVAFAWGDLENLLTFGTSDEIRLAVEWREALWADIPPYRDAERRLCKGDLLYSTIRLKIHAGLLDQLDTQMDQALQLLYSRRYAALLHGLLVDLVQLYKRTEDWERAKIYQRVLVGAPFNDPRAYRECGTLCGLTWEINPALKYLRVAAELQPDDPVVYRQLGKLYLSTSRPAAAIPYLQRAVALSDDAPAVHLDLARALVMVGQTTLAAEEFHRAAPTGSPSVSSLPLAAGSAVEYPVYPDGKERGFAHVPELHP